MNPVTNDWASSDPTQNITFADADQFQNQLASAVAIQFAERFVKTAIGEIINEAELRRNPLPAAPVNLWGTLVGVASAQLNVAQLRTSVRAAAQSDNPSGEFQTILQQAFPKSDPSSVIMRLPGVMVAIAAALAQIS